MCIKHFLREAWDSVGIEVTLEEKKSILKLELSTNKDYGCFTTSRVNISKELQVFLNSPLTITTQMPLICSCLHLVTFLISTLLYLDWKRMLGWGSNDGCNRKTIHFVPEYWSRSAYPHTTYVIGWFCRNYKCFIKNWRWWRGIRC